MSPRPSVVIYMLASALLASKGWCQFFAVQSTSAVETDASRRLHGRGSNLCMVHQYGQYCTGPFVYGMIGKHQLPAFLVV